MSKPPRPPFRHYEYSQEQARRYHRRVHDLTHEVRKLKQQRDHEVWRRESLHSWGNKELTEGGKRKAVASFVDSYLVGKYLEEAGRLVADAQADAKTSSGTNHGWVGQLSWRLCGSYDYYLRWRKWVIAVYGAWRFFRWRSAKKY